MSKPRAVATRPGLSHLPMLASYCQDLWIKIF
jgi:hypothetical protein